jgi:hypothetical protein
MYRLNELLKKIKHVRKENDNPNRANVYRNRFWGASGRDV